MSTTAVFAELVVGGFQTLTWLVLIAMTTLGPHRFAPLLKASSLTSVLVIAVSYPLGVVFDRIWDEILDRTGLNDWIKREAQSRALQDKEEDSEFSKIRRRVFGSDPMIRADFVNYNRSRMRVARASVFNSALITFSGLACVMVHLDHLVLRASILIATGGIFLCLVSGAAYYNLGKSHYQVLRMVATRQDQSAREGTPKNADIPSRTTWPHQPWRQSLYFLSLMNRRGSLSEIPRILGKRPAKYTPTI